MDMYTVSLCLPRSSFSGVLTPGSSFDYGSRDENQPPANTQNTFRAPASSIASLYHQPELFPNSPNASTVANRRSNSSLSTDNSASTVGTSITSLKGSVDMTDALNKLSMEIMSTHQCLVSFTSADSPSLVDEQQNGRVQRIRRLPSSGDKIYNFQISGNLQQVLAARGALLRDAPFQYTTSIKVARSDVLDNKNNVKLDMRRKLDDISTTTNAFLSLHDAESASVGNLDIERNVYIKISGEYESVEQAKVRLLVLLDELGGLHCEALEIDFKLHNIIADRQRSIIDQIQSETSTNIYLPTPVSGVLGTKNAAVLSKQNLIFITGEFFAAKKATDMLFQVSLHCAKRTISRTVAILSRKIDWLLLEKLEEVKQIMYDNGTYIQFPVLGSQISLISVYGVTTVHIERTIRSVMHLICQYYVASVWILPPPYESFVPPNAYNLAQIPYALQQISTMTGAETVFKNHIFELHGLEHQVKAAVAMTLEFEAFKTLHHDIKFQIELSNEHREFISGKKNGKMNKIQKTAGVKIRFENLNEHNFLIDLSGSQPGALQALSLLQEEMPAEMSFHIPEAYHKRIIGVGGKNIQKIMKKYGVYVKFSNKEEYALIGGYAGNEDNVIARTPAKNASNLSKLKQSIMELVNPPDSDYLTESLSIPRKYHRLLAGESGLVVKEIESKTDCVIRFSNKESGSDVVTVWGPESQVQIATKMLLGHVPFEAEYRVPHTSEMATLTTSQDYLRLTERITNDMNVSIMTLVDRSGNAEDTIIRFTLNRSNMDTVSEARDIVEEYLINRNIALYPDSLRPRESFVQASFPFFNSKLLSSMASENDLRSATTTSARQERGLRLAASSPNIKALFDGGGQSYGFGRRATQEFQPALPPMPTHHHSQSVPPATNSQPNFLRHSQSQSMSASQASNMSFNDLPPSPHPTLLRHSQSQSMSIPHRNNSHSISIPHHQSTQSLQTDFNPWPTSKRQASISSLQSLQGYPSVSHHSANRYPHSSQLSHDEETLMRLTDAKEHRRIINRAQSLDLTQTSRQYHEQKPEKLLRHQESVEELNDVLGQLGID